MKHRTASPETTLSTKEAMILQQLHDNVEDDVRSLSYELGMSQRAVVTTALQLEQKGLVDLHNNFDGLWMNVSRKGKRLVQALWPESRQLAM